MLPGKGNRISLHAGSTNEKLPVVMETCECVVELVKCMCSDGIAACNIAKFKKCREAFDYLRRYMTGNRAKINLQSEKPSAKNRDVLPYDVELTFISAFESSPVHCKKSRPSGKRRNPGNGGMAEMLTNLEWLAHVCY
jgi:hypothetical protein